MKQNKIPTGWSIKKLAECLKILHGKSQYGVETINGKYPILASSGEIGKTNSYLYDKPSVLIGRKGTINKPQYMDIPFWTIDTLFYSEINKHYVPKYLYYLFCTINWNKYNEASGIPSLSSKTIMSIKCLVPDDLSEQNKIVKILETWDSAIDTTKKLIEQKELQKKSLMQKLLSGKYRLNNFNNKWEKFKIKDIVVKISTGLNPRNNFVLNNGGKNYYVTIKNFEQGILYLDNNCDKIDNKALSLIQKRSDLQKGDILFSSIGRVGDCYLINKEPTNWNINESVFVLRSNNKIILPIYLFNTIYSNYVKNQINSNITGSTLKSIKIQQLKDIKVKIPTDKNEQKAIADILTTADKEIDILKEKLSKLELQKKGLMQKLLTGQIRLC